MYLTQEQIDVLSQNLRKKYLRIELLDFNLKTIDTIEGHAIGGSITANADNDIRRSGNVVLAIPTNPSAVQFLDQLDGYSIEIGGKIWLDKYVKILVGVENIHTNKIVWYKLGTFLINQPTRNFSATDYTISFECIDLMAKLTGKRQGQLTGTTTMIEQGYYETVDGVTTYVKTRLADAIASVISELGGFSNYTIYPIPTQYEYLPYDIKVGVGSTVYDLLKKLLDIITTWQMYFDLDGMFIVCPIPSGKNAIVYDLDGQQYISDDLSVDFESIKNQVVVYGRLNTLTYYTENTAGSTANVIYQENTGGTTATLVLKYSAITTGSLTISGTTFGFQSLGDYNTLPITNVEIWSGDTQLLYTHDTINIQLTKFENATNEFGKSYATTQVEARDIAPNDIYFIRIYSASLLSTETVDVTQSISFEFMGKQQVAYDLVNDNLESPYYINSGLNDPNFYAGLASSNGAYNVGENYELTLNNAEVLSTLVNGTIITFKANYTNSYASGFDFTSIDVNNFDGSSIVQDIPIVQNTWVNNTRPYLQESKLSNDFTIWQLRYENQNGNEWFVLVNRCPTAITKVFSSGEYDNIYADQLAYERCLYELFTASNLQNSITLSVVPNYLIDVNNKIAYDPNNSLPQNIYDTQPFTTVAQTGYQQFVTANNEYFYVRASETQYFITKNITYPLGLDNTPQPISAIQIYDSGNLVGEDF